MIVFDLRCGAAHVFEAWFGSTGDYEAQGARGLISCPICGNGDIGKAAMAPAVPAKSNRRQGNRNHRPGNDQPRNDPLDDAKRDYQQPGDGTAFVAGTTASAEARVDTSPAAIKAMLRGLAAAQAHVEANCDDVGERFAAIARAIHDGEAPPRGIFGEATRAEVAALLDDGIAVAPLPFRSRRHSDA